MTGISEDSTYLFTIDGVPFNQLPHREEARRRSSTLGGNDTSGNKYVGRYGETVNSSDSSERRPSYNSNSGRDSFSNRGSRGSGQFNIQSPSFAANKHSDPFADPLPAAPASGSSFASDPFANDPFATKSDPFASQPANTSKSAASSVFPPATSSVSSSDSTFDPFAASSTAAATQDPFAAPAAPPAVPRQQQAFQPQPPPAPSAVFGVLPGAAPVPPPLPAKREPERADNPFTSGVRYDPFASNSSSNSAPAPEPAPAIQPDLFDSPVTTTTNNNNSLAALSSTDPFASDVSDFGGSTSNAATSLGGDGGLMSINFSMPTNVQSPTTQQSPQQTSEQLPEPPVQEDVKCTVTKGINSLVDLDLGGSSIKRDTDRRMSSTQGPSLTSLLGPTTANNSINATASLTTGMSNFDPFGNKPMAPPMQNMGGMTMQGQQPGMGMLNNINSNNNMAMQPPMGGMSLNAPHPMMGGTGFAPPPPLATTPNSNFRSGSISTMMQPQNIGLNLNNNPYQDPTKQKTSLDSLGSW